MELAQKDNVFYIFTGDGDFEFLIRNVILKGIKCYVVSSANKVRIAKRYFISRLSKKLRKLCAENLGVVGFVEIDRLKMRIKKENATQVDVL